MKHKYNLHQIAKIYMTSGGVPFYLKNFKKNISVDQNINKLFFDPDGIFYNEFDELFASLFEESDHYIEIMQLIA